MAEFDPNAPYEEVVGPRTFDPNAPSEAVPDHKTSTLEAVGTGLTQGASANWADELMAASAASGLPQAVPGTTPIGVARLAWEHLTGKRGEATETYERALKQIRDRNKQVKEEHPYAYGAGEIGGAGTTMLMAPAARVATLAGRAAQAAKVGAVYGAASGAGEGENLADTALGTLTGAGLGAVGGAAAVPVGAAVGKVGSAVFDKTIAPAVNILRGWANPADEALRRTTGNILKDAPRVAAGQGQGFTPAQYGAQRAAGEPTMLMDLGSANTKALLRSAANTSPEARDVITNAIDQRFRTQAERGGYAIRNLLPGGANAAKTRAQLEADYNLERSNLYNAAYTAGDRPLRTPVLERLMGSRAVVGAMKDAVAQGQDRAVSQGAGAFNSAVSVTPDGRVVFRRGPSGVPTFPNLQFWDQTYRSLRDSASVALRAGRNSEGSVLQNLANTLRTELDKTVPEYGKARGFAKTFFGGNDAIEAGQKAVGFRGDVGQLKMALAKMAPAERELFKESYADTWARKLEAIGDNRDITTGLHLTNSINDRKKVDAIFGPQGAATIQAFADREKIFDSARKALGNSTTVRQWIEAGLAGGAGGAIGSYFEGTQGGVGGFLAGASFHHAPRAMMTSITQKLVGYVDQRVANQVAQLLTSDDPAVLRRGLQLVAGNRRLSNALTALRDRLALAVSSGSAPNAARIPLPATAPVAGDANTQTAETRASGGRVRAEEVLPPSHKLGMRVPRGGSRCGNCRFLSSATTCGNKGFVAWNGTEKLPAPKDEYCCDLYEHGRGRATGGRALAAGGLPDSLQPEEIPDLPQDIGTHQEPSYEPGEAAQDAAEAAAARQRAPYARANDRESGLPTVLGMYGERLANALTAPKRALTGEMQVTDPETGMPTREAIEAAQGVTGLAMTGGIPMAREGALGMAGGKLRRSANAVTPGAEARAVPDRGGVRGGPVVVAPPRGADLAHSQIGAEPLEGLPRKVVIPGLEEPIEAGPHMPARQAADNYAREVGLPYNPPLTYAKVDVPRAQRIAQAFDEMKHDPTNPEVLGAYQKMVDETMAQWNAIKKTGLKVEFMPPGVNMYKASPRLAIEDVKNNNHLWVFPTREGFGTDPVTGAPNPISAQQLRENPLLAETGETISGQPALANDLFRIVHDYFGHIKEGVGFRADGEENAWRSHSAMYSPEARRAMTTETRGQNSWLNHGPHGEKNRAAKTEDTVFADQKIGLLPDWVVNEGAVEYLPERPGSPKIEAIRGEYAHLAESYPMVGEPVLTDKKTLKPITRKMKPDQAQKLVDDGKAYWGKGETVESSQFLRDRKIIDKEMTNSGYPRYFDPSKRGYVDPSNYKPAKDMGVLTQPAKEATRKEHEARYDTPEANARLQAGYEAGKEIPDAEHWYAMKQLEDEYVKELGPVEGRARFNTDFAGAMAATTGGGAPTPNLLMAAYVNHLKATGANFPTNAYQMPSPIGGRYAGSNVKMAKSFFEKPEPYFDETNPKRHDFQYNFLGDPRHSTTDEQMTGALVPGLAQPSFYGPATNVIRKAATKNKTTPMNFQDVTWAGLKKLGGDKSRYAGPMIEHVNRAIYRTSVLTGLPQREVVRRMILHRAPLYGAVGAVGAAAYGYGNDRASGGRAKASSHRRAYVLSHVLPVAI